MLAVLRVAVLERDFAIEFLKAGQVCESMPKYTIPWYGIETLVAWIFVLGMLALWILFP